LWCPVAGKTRTKDKYRVVYSDHQRLELEKEFHYSRYITIRRKAELAANLGLSERQVSKAHAILILSLYLRPVCRQMSHVRTELLQFQPHRYFRATAISPRGLA
jgi:hypothetical protein